MTAFQAIAEGRAYAELLMVDLCEVRWPATAGEMDPETGESTVTPGGLVYSGRFKIQFADTLAQPVDAGGRVFTVQRYELHFPVSAPRVLEDHRVTVTASAVSPHNVGRSFRVTGPGEKTFTTAQRVTAEEVVDRGMA